MGIEPTQDARTPRNGFEDRGAHQDSSASSKFFLLINLINMYVHILLESKKQPSPCLKKRCQAPHGIGSLQHRSSPSVAPRADGCMLDQSCNGFVVFPQE